MTALKSKIIKKVFCELAYQSGRLVSKGMKTASRIKELKDSLPEMIRRGLTFYCFLLFGIFLLKESSLDKSLPSREKVRQRFRSVLPDEIASKLSEVIIDQRRLPTTLQIKKMCELLKRSLPIESRYELLKMLISFVRVDGTIETQEINVLRWIAQGMGVEGTSFEQLLNTFMPNTSFVDRDSFYAILGINKSSTPEQIHQAYRKLAAKYHPDKFATRHPKEQQIAHNNFIEINKAFQRLKGT